MNANSIVIQRSYVHRLLILFTICFISACSSVPEVDGEAAEPAYFDSILKNTDNNDTLLGEVYDPWEGLNRSIYGFNYRADRYVLLPIVSGYQYVTPDLMQKGIHNFFNNIKEITTLINSVLQLKVTKSYQTMGRLLTNTTVGLLGTFDVASEWGIPKHKEDFGQTMGYWGVDSGPYLVIPLLGPSTLRDGVGTGVDTIVMSNLKDQLNMKWEEELALTLLEAVDTRANITFRYYETGSPFEYELVRKLWMTKRQLDIEK